MRVNIKPFSVNKAWKGRRYRTDEYKAWSQELTYLLKAMEIPEGPLELRITWGVSNMQSDTDNPCKPFQDVLSAYLGINDSRFRKITLEKVKTAKKAEFIDYEILSFG